MSRLPSLMPKEVVKALEKDGFTVVRVKGSHYQLKKGNLLVTVPMHGGDLSKTTLRSVLRQAKMRAEDLLEFL